MAYGAAGGTAADLGRPTTLWLVRHARTEDTGRRVRGGSRAGPPLDAEGRRQAERTARLLVARSRTFEDGGQPGPGVSRPVAVVSAPALRARRTAETLAAALADGPPHADGPIRGDRSIRIDDEWAEVGLGEWDGLSYPEIAAGWPEEYRRWRELPAAAPPGGESLEAVSRRVAAARASLVAAHPGRTVVVVSHTAPIRAVLAQALDAGPAAMWRLRVDPASLSVVRYWQDGGCEVAGVNLAGVDPSGGDPGGGDPGGGDPVRGERGGPSGS